MIEIEGLTKTYGTKVVLTVEQWSLKGGNCVLVGENAAGKTTLLLTLAGLEHPSKGSARINGHASGSRAATLRAAGRRALW